MEKIKFLYNPRSGTKKSFRLARKPGPLLHTIHGLLRKYEIAYDESPIREIGDARRLAEQAVASGFETIVVAGGDGTIGMVANALVGTPAALGILPIGTYVNTARMLSVPFDLELAVMVLKMKNIRHLDVGEILSMDGTGKHTPSFFLESAGIGVEAQFQSDYLAWERGDRRAPFRMLNHMAAFRGCPIEITLDGGRAFQSPATVMTVANGPIAGAAIPVAPDAKLNDHLLTIRLYRMTPLELVGHLLHQKLVGTDRSRQVDQYVSTFVRVSSRKPLPVHADARVFGRTPVTIKIRPAALRAIAGYPDHPQDAALLMKKTYLEP